MVEQVLIEFIADTSQIQGVIPTLEKIGQLSKSEAEALKKISASSANASRSSNDAGQKTSKTLKDVEKGAKQMANALDKAFKEGVAKALEEAGVSMDEFKAAMKDAGISMDDFKGAVEGMVEGSDQLKKELRQTMDVMAALAKMGARNSEEYENLAEKAAELKKAISDANRDAIAFGSDTPGVDKLLTGLRGVAGGFAVAQGAAALFGDESEEMQKTLLKVNAAMAIMQGLKEISDTLNSREFASLTTLLGAKQLDVLQTNLQSAAESKNIVVRYGAIAAQKALNAVMAVSPLGWIVIAVTALAAGWALFTTNARKAAVEQARLNDALDQAGKYLDVYLKGIDDNNAKHTAALKSRGATYKEITNAEVDAAKARINAISQEISAAQKVIDSTKTTNKESIELKKQLTEKKLALEEQFQDEIRNLEIKQLDYQRKVYEDEVKSYQAFADAKVAAARRGSIAELSAQIEAAKAAEKATKDLNPDLTKGELAKLAAETNKTITELSNQIRIKQLEDQKFLMEAKLATIREGSIAELEERKKIAAKSREIEMAELGISESQRKALKAQNEKEQLEFDRQISDRRIQEELNVINTKIAAAKRGSDEEYQQQQAALKKQYELAINQKGITDEAKELLTAEYYRKVEDMDREHQLKISEEAIAIRKSQIQTELANLDNSSTSSFDTRVLELRKKAIDEETALQIAHANATIDNEEQLQAKIIEIRTSANAQKENLETDRARKEMQYQLEITNLVLENEKKRAELEINSGTINQQIEARKKYTAILKQQIDEEERAYDNMYAEGLINYEDWNKRMLEIQGKRIDQELAAEKEKEARRRELINSGFDALQAGFDAAFDVGAQYRQKELDDQLNKLGKQYEAEINNKALTEEQKEVIDQRYRNREAQLKKAAWLKDRQAKIGMAIMNGILAASNALATVQPYPAAIAAAASAGILAGINVAKIRSEPIPAFKTGTKKAPKGFALVGEEGPELVRLNGGERIWNYRQSNKILDAWRGGSTASPEDILKMTATPIVDYSVMKQSTSGKLEIDYQKLGKEISKNIPQTESVRVENVMDDEGFAHFVIKKGNKTRIRNKRYTIGK